MAYTSPTVKDRYNRKAYDRVTLFVPKGRRDTLKARADSLGVSVNAYINGLVVADLHIPEEEWKQKS